MHASGQRNGASKPNILTKTAKEITPQNPNPPASTTKFPELNYGGKFAKPAGEKVIDAERGGTHVEDQAPASCANRCACWRAAAFRKLDAGDFQAGYLLRLQFLLDAGVKVLAGSIEVGDGG